MGDESKTKPVDLKAEEKYWREHHQSQPHATEGTTYEHFAPAYRVGAEAAVKYPGKQFHEIEDDLALDYEKHQIGSALPWDHVHGGLEGRLVQGQRLDFSTGSVPRHARQHLIVAGIGDPGSKVGWRRTGISDPGYNQRHWCFGYLRCSSCLNFG